MSEVKTGEYRCEYPREWVHLQYEIRRAVKYGLSDRHIGVLVQVWRDQGLKFSWEPAEEFEWHLDGVAHDGLGLYCADIGRKHIGWIKKKVDRVLRSLGMRVVSHSTWTDSVVVGEGGLFTSMTYWTEEHRKLFIVVGDVGDTV